MVGLVDFHSHILPNMDDGSRGADMSLEMLKRSFEQGVKRIVATPHFYPARETPDDFLKRRDASAESLRLAVEGEENIPEIHLGAEIAYFSGIGRSALLDKLAIKGTRVVLIEMPFNRWSDAMIDDVAMASSNLGLTTVMAHIERYASAQSKDVVEELISRDIIMQANAESFLRLGKGKMVKMLQSRAVCLLGSDCHDLNERCPNLGDAARFIEKKAGSGVLDDVFELSENLLSSAESLV